MPTICLVALAVAGAALASSIAVSVWHARIHRRDKATIETLNETIETLNRLVLTPDEWLALGAVLWAARRVVRDTPTTVSDLLARLPDFARLTQKLDALPERVYDLTGETRSGEAVTLP